MTSTMTAKQRRGAAPARRDLASALRRLLAGVADAARQELRLRRAMRQLAAFPDRHILDLGLTRSEVGTVVRYGRSVLRRGPQRFEESLNPGRISDHTHQQLA
jgi:uncharacterized protein YjiS (DUF1127 family)